MQETFFRFYLYAILRIDVQIYFLHYRKAFVEKQRDETSTDRYRSTLKTKNYIVVEWFMKHVVGSIFFVLTVFPIAKAGPEFITTVPAIRTHETIIIDGNLAETAWLKEGVSSFYQENPDQGSPTSERTVLWIAYDDAAIYVAAKLYDSHPDSIVARLTRRDTEAESDVFYIAFDSYHDHRTGTYFGITAAGTKIDGIFYNDDWNDNSWDGVWDAASQRTVDGWSAEFRIPFSQLRFEEQERYVFGINALRKIARKKEQASLVYTPRNESGFVSRFPHLVGIEYITPPRRFEALPYFSGKAEHRSRESNNPFRNTARYTPNIGVDVKFGLGTNLTVQGTVNPDFGQVEVDPAVVNLSDVETYYSEKRPFFLEGMSIFSFGQGGVKSYWNFNWRTPQIFYTRRIGRSPQRSLPSYDYANLPTGTRILGAAKLTGKIFDGWNVGWIEAFTNREYGEFDTNRTRWNLEMEPQTLYSIARMQKDFNDGKQGVGFMLTQTQRFFSDGALRDEVNANAFVGGVDGWTALDSDKEYMLAGWAAFSRVTGSQKRMLGLQQSWTHYFQRPNRSYVHVDSTATSMEGTAGRLVLNKQRGRFVLNAALGWISPGFETGDVGYLSRTDFINYHIATGYQWNDPTEYYRSTSILFSYFKTTEFGGMTQWHGLWGRVWYQFTNYHSMYIFYDYGFPFYDLYATRGGPALRINGGQEWGIGYSTDSRRNISGEADYYAYTGENGSSYSVSMYGTFRPSPSIAISVGPAYTHVNENPHWIDTFDDPSASDTYGKRYLFADMEYRELSAQFRIDWTLSPMLSFQLFLQPLFSTGKFSRYRSLRFPDSFTFDEYGKNGATWTALTDGSGAIESYEFDNDGSGPAPTMSIENPDFSTVSLRSSAVLRWEYLNGSTLYLVWTHNRYESDEYNGFRIRPLLRRLSRAEPQSIIMLKITYWFGV